MSDVLHGLIGAIGKYSIEAGINPTAIEGVRCIRLANVSGSMPAVYNPSVCIVVQGTKQVMLEGEVYKYGASQYFAVSVDMPVFGQVLEAAPEKPYLCLQVDLDPMVMSELLSTAEGLPPEADTGRGLYIGSVDASMMDAIARLLRLLDTPQDIPLLAPMVLREIHYRILRGEHGRAIAQMAVAGSNMQKIAEVVRHMKQNLSQTLAVEDLAQMVNMSASSFHAHFKRVTAMSPLQYHKRLRLNEARQIMLLENTDAASTAYKMGYESASQFSREYARMFGEPPMRNIQQMKSVLYPTTGVA